MVSQWCHQGYLGLSLETYFITKSYKLNDVNIYQAERDLMSVGSTFYGATPGSKNSVSCVFQLYDGVTQRGWRALLAMHDYTEWLWPERERLCWLVSLSVSSVCPSGPLLLLLHNVFNMQEHSVCVNWWSWLHIRITGEPAHHALSLSARANTHTDCPTMLKYADTQKHTLTH